MLNAETFKKMSVEAQAELEQAQVEELIERRGVRDPKLFRECYDRAVEEVYDETAPAWMRIDGFNDLAEKAFEEYHQLRKAQDQTDAPDTALGGTAPDEDE